MPGPLTSAYLASPGSAWREGVEVNLDVGEHHQIGALQAGLVLFKAIVGPSILFLPAGVKNAGLLSACLVSVGVAAVSTWCMLLLLDAAKQLRRRGLEVQDIGDLGEAAFSAGGRLAVTLAVVMSQLGFCTAYCIFIGETVQAVIFEVHGGTLGRQGEGEPCDLPAFLADRRLVYWIILVLVPLIIPSTWVRQLRYFAVTNLIASSLVVVGLLYMILCFCIQMHRGMTTSRHVCWFKPSGTLVYLGTAMYAFEGIGVLLPTERSMANPEQMGLTACCTMAFACLLQVSFSGMAYWLYGQSTKSIITTSLSDGYSLGGLPGVELLQLAWVVEVCLTFPLQLFPAARFLEPLCFRRGLYRCRHSGWKWRKNAIRTGLLLLCMAAATGGLSSVDNLVSLIGALGCVPLAIVYPAFIHWRVAFSLPGRRHSAPSPQAAGAPLAPVGQGSAPDAPKGGPVSDLAIGVGGTLGVLLATVLAIKAWATSSFEFQICIRRA